MFTAFPQQGICSLRLVLATFGVALCLLVQGNSVEAACGDWLAGHKEHGAKSENSPSEVSGLGGGIAEGLHGDCQCRSGRCVPGNPHSGLPVEFVSSLELNEGLLPKSEDALVVHRDYRLMNESVVHPISVSSSIFHPPRSV